MSDKRVFFAEGAVYATREGYAKGEAARVVERLMKSNERLSDARILNEFRIEPQDISPDRFKLLKSRIAQVLAHFVEAHRSSEHIPTHSYAESEKYLHKYTSILHDVMHTAIAFEKCRKSGCAQIAPAFFSEDRAERKSRAALDAAQEEAHAFFFGFTYRIATMTSPEEIRRYVKEIGNKSTEIRWPTISRLLTHKNLESIEGKYKVIATIGVVYLAGVVPNSSEWLDRVLRDIDKNPDRFLMERIGRLVKNNNKDKSIFVSEFLSMTDGITDV